jgi:hypothetical protein
MKSSIPLMAGVFMLATLTGCASLDSKLEREFEQIRRGPAGAPYKSVTNFSDALSCMDGLMQAKGVNEIPIMVEDLEDKTDSVKTGTRDMLISAISRMTTRSKAIKLIAYGKDSGNLVSFMKAANYTGGYKQMPLYDIQGSISQFDKGVASADSSLGLFKKRDGGAGAAHSASLNVIALDLNVLRAADMSVIPGVTSSNSVAIFQRGDSLNMDASINKLGVYFDLNLSSSEGQAQAVRNLVDLAAVELVGKLVGVPYASCLGAKDDARDEPSPFLTQQTVAAEPETAAPPVAPASIAKLPKLTPKKAQASKAETDSAKESDKTEQAKPVAPVITAVAAPAPTFEVSAPNKVAAAPSVSAKPAATVGQVKNFDGKGIIRVKRVISTEVIVDSPKK